MGKISIHAPTRGATHGVSDQSGRNRYFNPRSYKRSDVVRSPILIPFSEFQSTLLQEERQDLIFRSAVEFLFQSTLLQEERRGIFTQKTDRNLISIHAPTRGATLMNFLTDVLYEFQSTLLQEERHVGNGYMYWISKISIHAPTRGATHGPCECLQLYPYFNPRSYKRSDYYDVVVDRDVDLFQSTLLQEERRRIVCPADHYSYFNPRSYKRSDRVLFFCPQIPQDFNPRSYKRSDIVFTGSFNHQIYFNPRSYKRSDHCST